jgi:GNAT superfamily N-acetyltransferase
MLLARVAERAAGFGHDRVTVRAGAVPSETAYVEALTEAGFTFIKRYARMTRSLVGFTSSEPPTGVTVRPVRSTELRDFHAVVEEAFVDSLDHEPIAYDGWRARIDALPSVSYDEWFVAHVDGVLAGVLQSADQNVELGEGWVRMLAVLRPYRRRGVGAALLSRAFAAYAGKGRTAAGLGVDLTNPTAPESLYRSMGLTPSFEADMYERDVTASTSGSAGTAGR